MLLAKEVGRRNLGKGSYKPFPRFTHSIFFANYISDIMSNHHNKIMGIQ
jgi:hypothetical protein